MINVRRYPATLRLVLAGHAGRSSLPNPQAAEASRAVRSAESQGMPGLTLRGCSDAHQETWLIHYRDVRVGRIAIRAGVPLDVDQWGWSCGIYPTAGSHRDDNGTAPNFKKARRDFDAAWRVLLPKLTEADFEAWRRQRDFTAWKHAMRDAGLATPTATATGVSRCFCGATITIGDSWEHIFTAHTATE
jgi:hypothetical protein